MQILLIALGPKQRKKLSTWQKSRIQAYDSLWFFQDTENGPAPVEELMHTVSFYRKTKPVVTPAVNVRKIVRMAAETSSSDEAKEDEVGTLKIVNIFC